MHTFCTHPRRSTYVSNRTVPKHTSSRCARYQESSCASVILEQDTEHRYRQWVHPQTWSLLFPDDEVLPQTSNSYWDGLQLNVKQHQVCGRDPHWWRVVSVDGFWTSCCFRWRSSSVLGSCLWVEPEQSRRLTGRLGQDQYVLLKRELSWKAEFSFYQSVCSTFQPSAMVIIGGNEQRNEPAFRSCWNELSSKSSCANPQGQGEELSRFRDAHIGVIAPPHLKEPSEVV